MPAGYVYFFASLLGLILQGSLLRKLIPFDLVPNFSVILIVHIAFFWQRQYAVWLVFVLGLLVDLFGSAALLGPHASAAVLIYLFITAISKRLYMESIMTLLVVVFSASLLNSLVVTLIHNQFTEAESLWTVMSSHAPFEAIGSAVFGYFVFYALKKLGMANHSGTRSAGFSWSS